MAKVFNTSARRLRAKEALKQTRKQKQALHAQVASVDANFGVEMTSAKKAVDIALKELGHLEPIHFTELGKFLHPPAPIVRSCTLWCCICVSWKRNTSPRPPK